MVATKDTGINNSFIKCLYFVPTIRIVGQKEKENTSINFNRNYRREVKLVSITMDYYLLSETVKSICTKFTA